MDLYSKGTFGKDATQWAKCVVKYLHDNYAEQVQYLLWKSLQTGWLTLIPTAF